MCIVNNLFAANEIRSFEAGATTCYAVVREIDGDVWYPVGLAFEVWGTGGRTAADYDIALTNKTGGMFVGSMDTNIAAGQYYIVTHQQAGAGPADTDPAIWQEYGDWTGTTWTPATITPADIADSVWDEVIADHTGETTFGGELGTLDPNITAILGDTNELQTDWTNGGRLDLLIDGIKAITDVIPALTTTIASVTDPNTFVLTAGLDANDVYNGMFITIKDATDSHFETRMVENWEVGRTVTADVDFGFTPAASDPVWLWSIAYFPPRVYDNIPLERHTTTETVDRRTAVGGGTRTLDVVGDDP